MARVVRERPRLKPMRLPTQFHKIAVAVAAEASRSVVWRGGGLTSPPRTTPAKRKLEEETQVAKGQENRQWVSPPPPKLTENRWRNEFVNEHEINGVGVHYGVVLVVHGAPRELQIPVDLWFPL